MRPVILYRPHDGLDTSELDAANKFLPVISQRTSAMAGDLIIGRYSVLPFYRELWKDLEKVGARLINTPGEHSFMADVGAWASVLGDMTPRTWDRLQDLPEGVSFVVKGQTNSRKDRWLTHMFAEDKGEAIRVTLLLQEDSLIQTQRIYYREYVPLVNLGYGLNGMPISEEFRVFVLDGAAIASGFYWSSHVGDVQVPKVTPDIIWTAERAVARMKEESCDPRFVVVDVARTQSGQNIVIEINDAQMSGLSEIDPHVLYSNLKYSLVR